MPQVTATVEVPITVNWNHGGVAAGEQGGTAKATVTRTVDDPENWTAVGNWAAGQDDAEIGTGGSGSGGGGGSESGSGGGGSSGSGSGGG